MSVYRVVFDDGQEPLTLSAEEAWNVLASNGPRATLARRWAALHQGERVPLLVGYLLCDGPQHRCPPSRCP